MNMEIHYILILHNLVAGVSIARLYNSDTIVHRTELDNAIIDITESFEITNVRSLAECLAICRGMCHLLSYHILFERCRIYTGLMLENEKIIGTDSGVAFYRLQDCPAGMYLNNTGCVSCSPGSYQNQSGATTCMGCQNNYYQILAGQQSCTPCLSTAEWRYGTNTDRTKCIQCWEYYNTYTDGDMSQLISSFTANASWVCGYECDRTTGCLLFTWRELESTCYLHSSDDWDWGYVFRSVIHRKLC